MTEASRRRWEGVTPSCLPICRLYLVCPTGDCWDDVTARKGRKRKREKAMRLRLSRSLYHTSKSSWASWTSEKKSSRLVICWLRRTEPPCFCCPFVFPFSMEASFSPAMSQRHWYSTTDLVPWQLNRRLPHIGRSLVPKWWSETHTWHIYMYHMVNWFTLIKRNKFN